LGFPSYSPRNAANSSIRFQERGGGIVAQEEEPSNHSSRLRPFHRTIGILRANDIAGVGEQPGFRTAA
jgi:hypothetical protein